MKFLRPLSYLISIFFLKTTPVFSAAQSDAFQKIIEAMKHGGGMSIMSSGGVTITRYEDGTIETSGDDSDVSCDMKREWDTSEEGFSKHLADLKKTPDFSKTFLLSQWSGSSVLNAEQFSKILTTASDSKIRIAMAEKLLLQKACVGHEFYDAEILLHVILPTEGAKWNIEDRIRILQAAELASYEDQLEAVNTLPPQEALKLLGSLVSNGFKINPDDSVRLYNKLSPLDEASKVKAAKFLLSEISLNSQSIKNCITSVSDYYKSEMIKALKCDSLNGDDIQTIVTGTSDYYKKATLVLLTGYVAIPRKNAFVIFKSTSDYYKIDVINAGVFDGSQLTADHVDSAVNSVSDYYKNKVRSALNHRYNFSERRVAVDWS